MPPHPHRSGSRRAQVPEHVVQKHGAAVDQVRDDHLAAFADRYLAALGVHYADWEQVDVQVAALARALPPDDPHLHRLVEAQDRDAQLLSHQPANRLGDRIGRIDDHLGAMKRALFREEVGVELLDVGAIALEEAGAELVEARRHLGRVLEEREGAVGHPLVEADPLNVLGIIRAVAVARVSGGGIRASRRLQRLPEIRASVGSMRSEPSRRKPLGPSRKNAIGSPVLPLVRNWR
jgi:hypothetical protein